MIAFLTLLAYVAAAVVALAVAIATGVSLVGLVVATGGGFLVGLLCAGRIVASAVRRELAAGRLSPEQAERLMVRMGDATRQS